MNQKCGKFIKRDRRGERGEGGFKLIVFLAILFLAVWAGYNAIPVFYNCQNYKQEMDTTVTQAMALPSSMGNPVGWSNDRLKRVAPEYGVPEDVSIVVKPMQNANGVEAQVKFKKPIAILPFYTYEYEFDYTARTNGMFSK